MDAPGIVPRRLSRLCGASVVTARGAVANRTEIPMKLTDTQLVLLCEAARREGGAIELAPTLKGVAAHRVVGKLLTEGLVEEIPAGGTGLALAAGESRDRPQAVSRRARAR